MVMIYKVLVKATGKVEKFEVMDNERHFLSTLDAVYGRNNYEVVDKDWRK